MAEDSFIANVGRMYLEGRGVERNVWQAVRYLEPAAKAGEWGGAVRSGFDRCAAGMHEY